MCYPREIKLLVGSLKIERFLRVNVKLTHKAVQVLMVEGEQESLLYSSATKVMPDLQSA